MLFPSSLAGSCVAESGIFAAFNHASCAAVSSCCSCLQPKIIQSYRKLCQRHQKLQTKQPSIVKLAEPIAPRKKFQKPSVCVRSKPKLNVVHLETPMHTRTEQLSFPRVNTLVKLRDHPSYSKFSLKRKSESSRLLSNSLVSLYSCLANAKLPIPKPKKKFTPKQWEKHKKRLKVLAKPQEPPKQKHPPKPKAPPQPVTYISLFERKQQQAELKRRLQKLSEPRVYCKETVKQEWRLTEKMRKHVPSKRILYMAEPRYHLEYFPDDTFKVKQKALHYDASQRIFELAEPPAYLERNISKNSFTVSRSALKAKPTERLIQMAKPIKRVDLHTRINPYKISRSALKAKATSALRELAKPKRPPSFRYRWVTERLVFN